MAWSEPADNADHIWKEYDEHHRACLRCGLRLFWTQGTAYGQRGWVLLTYNGITSPPLLSATAGNFGACTPPPAPPIAETVIIEYTGDPDRHPSCERFMHRLPGGSSAALLDVRAGVDPVCGWICQWWELGPARDHVGWTWCGDCFAGQGRPRTVDVVEVQARRARSHQLPPRPPITPAARQLGASPLELPAGARVRKRLPP